MTHLDDITLIDLIDGRGTPPQIEHAQRCDRCRVQLTALEAALSLAKNDAVPEPSPLFWEHFTRRVNERIDAPASTWGRWVRGPRLAAVMSAAALVVAVAIGMRGPTVSTPDGIHVVTAPPAAAPPVDEAQDDIEADGAWAVVRTAAEDLAYDDAQAEGIAARPGSAEHAVMQMTADERAELARLIADEMKRTGA